MPPIGPERRLPQCNDSVAIGGKRTPRDLSESGARPKAGLHHLRGMRHRLIRRGKSPLILLAAPPCARVFVCHFGLNEPHAIPFDGQLGG